MAPVGPLALVVVGVADLVLVGRGLGLGMLSSLDSFLLVALRVILLVSPIIGGLVGSFVVSCWWWVWGGLVALLHFVLRILLTGHL